MAIGLCVVLGGAAALGATHVLNPGFGAFLDGGDPPGRALSPAELPAWITNDAKGRVSVLAEAGSHRLIGYHDRTGSICLEFDGHAELCEGAGELRRELAEEPVVLFGPTLDQSPERYAETTLGNLYGFVDGSVAKVRLEYPDGSSELASAETGAFMLPIDLARHPARVAALGPTGEVVGSIDISEEMKQELELVREEKQELELVREEMQGMKDSGG